MARQQFITSLPSPFLKRVWLPMDGVPVDEGPLPLYPFNLPIVRNGGMDFTFEAPVTILVGENGAGKSTVLEAIAQMAGFSESGGAQGMRAVASASTPFRGRDAGALGEHLRASWLPQVRNGWFFRAETFFSVARYLDESGSGYANFLSSSHGEGFLRFFNERLKDQGLYILDEPEAALSPQKQFDFLKIVHQMNREKKTQVIMATHSPILMALPGADLWHIDQYGVRPTRLEDTYHFQLYREFTAHPHEMVEAMIE